MILQAIVGKKLEVGRLASTGIASIYFRFLRIDIFSLFAAKTINYTT